jgi:RsiW-degrading membrane proteinase PrsW (M82 family)
MNVPTTPGFFDRHSLVTWVTIVLMVLGIYWQLSSANDLWSDTGGAVAAAVFWLAYGVIVGWLIFKLQLFEHRPTTATIAAVAWGAFVAGGIVALVGQDLQSLLYKLLGFETNREWGPAIRAPFVEETLKLLGVVALALIPRVNVSRTIDGLYYGMLSGLGFLISENAFFTNEAINFSGDSVGTALFETFLLRGLFALPFSHVVYSGIAGAGIGYFMSRRGRGVVGRVLVAFGFYVVAFLLHGFNNSPIFGDAEFSLFIKGIPALATFLVVLWWARKEYRTDLAAIADGYEVITVEDLDSLATRRLRRRAAKNAARREAARSTQRAAVNLLVTADIYGPGSAESSVAHDVLMGYLEGDTAG